ncbi:MAG: S-methyl-5-thioribose-1-phosphate isomerase, partial [Planctomycetota bacterium]
MPVATILWEGGRPGHVRLIDQTRLPVEYVVLDVRTVEEMFDCIRRLAVRGAPAIGVAAAFGLLLGVQHLEERDREDTLGRVRETAAYLAKSRPTAVNLFWALERMAARATRDYATGAGIIDGLFAEARAIFEEDKAICRRIGAV